MKPALTHLAVFILAVSAMETGSTQPQDSAPAVRPVPLQLNEHASLRARGAFSPSSGTEPSSYSNLRARAAQGQRPSAVQGQRSNAVQGQRSNAVQGQQPNAAAAATDSSTPAASPPPLDHAAQLKEKLSEFERQRLLIIGSLGANARNLRDARAALAAAQAKGQPNGLHKEKKAITDTDNETTRLLVMKRAVEQDIKKYQLRLTIVEQQMGRA